MMKIYYLLLRLLGSLLLVLLISVPAFACTTCNRPLQAAIFDESFLKLFFYMLLPFLFIGAAVYRLNKLK
jgi:hypothetical protein